MSDVNPTVANSQEPTGSPVPQAVSMPSAQRPLRIWPAVLIVVWQWAMFFGIGWLLRTNQDIENPVGYVMLMLFSGFLGFVMLLAWWLFASRRPGLWDRLLGVVVCVGMGALATLLADESYKSNYGMSMLIAAPRLVSTAWVGWLLVTPFLAWPVRRWGMYAAFALSWGFFTLFVFEGVRGSFQETDIRWRWSESPEAKAGKARVAEGIAPGRNEAAPEELVKLAPGDWPAFRGADRDGRLVGVKIDTEWDKHPPKLLWKKLVGPGWSSFTVVGKRVYTQEQWDQQEALICRDADTGKTLWSHVDSARFVEAVGGIGPRATPTFHDGKIYALGATGKLNCLSASSGKLYWSQDIAADSGAKVPVWGFASSPLVAQGLVSVYAGGPDGKAVLAYNASTGDLSWYAGHGHHGYCSPQLSKLAGEEQLLIADDAGLWALRPSTGDVLWKHDWQTSDVPRIVQPAVIGESDVLVGTGMGMGTRRVKVDKTDGVYSDKDVWTTKALNAYYNDFVIYKDNLYGFDGEYFTCVRLKDGKRQWKERGYGNGEVLLLADQAMLLILAEDGDVALVDATPDKLQERHRIKAIEGKTWNHPVIAHGRLYVRNSAEMACFELK